MNAMQHLVAVSLLVTLCVASAVAAPAPAATGSARATAGSPSAGRGGDLATDVSEADPELEPGTISATIVDARGVPLAGQQVRLGILFQKIAEGESRSEKFAQADAHGVARFSGLAAGSDRAYRVTVQADAASYQTSPFNLKPDMGQSVVLHVYPSTTEIEQAQVGMRGYLYIETRDDVFQFELMFRVFNMGQTTWLPDDVVMQLPKGFKAFKAQEGMTDVRFEVVDGVGARLRGSFSPGQNEASFRFQIPKSSEASVAFGLSLPPHVAEMRVIAEASSAMSLTVDGFPPPVVAANENGQRVLISDAKVAGRGEEINAVTATLSGIPTPGPGRWFALGIAGCMLVGGVIAAGGGFDDVNGSANLVADKQRARELLLCELVALEVARRTARIGPRSYEQSRTTLIDAIARLGLPAERPRVRRSHRKFVRAPRRAKSAAEG